MILPGRKKVQGIRNHSCNKDHGYRGLNHARLTPTVPCRAGPASTAKVSQKSTLPNKSILMGVTQEAESEWSSEMVTKARHGPRISTWSQVMGQV